MTALEDTEPQYFEAYLDIETTGLSPKYNEITVIGIYLCNGAETQFIQLVGDDISDVSLMKALEGADVIYTYNGKSFDLPFIHSCLGINLASLFAHHDLMYDCWRNNLYGGFKAVERQLGIHRRLTEVNGYEAVKLWWRYMDYFDLDALDTLLEYNKEDVINLKALKETLFQSPAKTGQREVAKMATLGNRRDANPIIVNPDGSTTKIRRFAFTETKLEEGWLQDLIENNPEVLPVAEIEPVFAPLVSIGREVETSVGYIDNLFLSPQGYLTIVETKLWRNPEARRQVVGQIIDYATDVSQWTYEQLENHVREYNKQYRGCERGIIDSIKLIEDIDEAEEQVIVDTISRNLQYGKFLLLVVGDGIRESVEAMADFLQQTPQLHFTLALVELQVYELKERTKRLLVIPQIIARTKEITRAVVRVEAKEIQSIHVEVDTEIRAPGGKKPPPRRPPITEEAFFDVLGNHVQPEDVRFARKLKQDMEKRGCQIEWKQSSFVVKMSDPGESGQRLSLLVVPKDGQTYIRGEFRNQLRSVGIPEQIAIDYSRESSRLFKDCEVTIDGNWSRPISLSELRQHYADFVSVIQKTIDNIRAASNE